MSSAYEIPCGTLVQVQLSETVFRGEFNLQLSNESLQQGGRNPSLDRVLLDQPLELPLGKKHGGAVSFPVSDIKRSNFSLQINPIHLIALFACLIPSLLSHNS